MAIKKEPFRKYNLDKKTDTFTIRLNERERKELEEAKHILNQSKDSTAAKQLMEIGKIVLHQGSTGKILQFLFKNKLNNNRLGIIDYD